MRIGQTSAVVFGSQLLSSVVGFVATVYLARMLGAGVLGTYFLVVAVVIWLQVLGLAGVPSALTKRLSEHDGDEGYVTAAFALATAVFLGISAVVLAFAGRVEAYLGAAVAPHVLLLTLVGLALTLVSAALQGQRLVHVAALLRPVDRTVRALLQVGAVVLGFGLVSLLVGYWVAGLLAGLLGVVAAIRLGSTRLVVPERRHFRGLFSFARYAWLGQLSSRTFSAMDTVVLGFFVVSELIGFYEVAWNLASILVVFGVAISQTLYPEISEAASRGDEARVRGHLEDALTYTGLFVIPGFVGSLVVGDRVLAIYGEGFATAHLVLVVLVVARLAYAYGAQFLTALNGLDEPDVAFRVNGAFVLTNVALNVALVPTVDWTGAAVATGVSATVTLVLGYRGLSGLLDVSIPTGEIARQWTAAVPMGAAVLAARQYVGGGALPTVGLVLLGVVVYFAALAAVSASFRTTVSRNLAFLDAR